MRWVVIWLVLAGAYLACAGVDAVPGERYGSGEALHLVVADSIVSGEGLRAEPQGVGLALVAAPAYAIGGAGAAAALLAGLAALAFVLGGLLARLVVPEPWVGWGTLLLGLSAPALAYGSAIHPELLAGGTLAAAVLFAVRAREQARLRWVYGSAALLAWLPWLGVKYLPAALVVLAALVVWTHRAGRRLTALIAAEVVAASLVVFATVNEPLYGGPTPYSALPEGVSATGADTAVEYLERVPRLATLLADPEFGLLRWTPALLIGVFALASLWRSRREGLARAVPGRAGEEAAALLALATAAAIFLVAVFVAPVAGGDWLGPRHAIAILPLAVLFVAWGLRHAPKPVALAAVAANVAVAGVLLAQVAGGGSWASP